MIGIHKRHKRDPPTVRRKRRRMTQKELFERLDIPRIICIHLIGENHTAKHRMGVGVIVMAVGVTMAKLTSHYYIIGFFGEMFGYLVHAVGTIPFGEQLASHIAKKSGIPTIKDAMGEVFEEEEQPNEQ